MRLLHVELEDFRNFERARLHLGRELSALVGENGQGKTISLEALYLLSALRPLRSVSRRALVRSGVDTARIRAEVRSEASGLTHQLEIRVEGGRRTLLRDEKVVPASDFLGTLVTVAFTPDDLQLAKAGPDGRRRFLDRALLNARPSYLGVALRYAKAMKDRNRLLATEGSDAELDAFDHILARDGARIVEARRALVDRFAPAVAARFAAIADPAPTLTLSYRSSVPPGDASLEARLLEALGERRARDRRRGTTGVGPHVDDLVFTLGGGAAKERASQGQHRALVLALKLTEIEDLGALLGEAPVLLLDDMSSELDRARTTQLFDAVRELEGQVLLTSTTPAEELHRTIAAGRELVAQRVTAGVLSPPETYAPETP